MLSQVWSEVGPCLWREGETKNMEGDGLSKPRDYMQRLVVGGRKMSGSSILWPSLKSHLYKEASTRLSHMYHALLKTVSLEQLLGAGKASGAHIQGEGRGDEELPSTPPGSQVKWRSRLPNTADLLSSKSSLLGLQ